MDDAISVSATAQEETRVDKMYGDSKAGGGGGGASISVASVFLFGAPSFLLRGTSYDGNVNSESSNSKEEGNDNDNEEEEEEEEEEDNKSGGNLIGYWLEGDSLAPPCQADMRVVDSIIEFAGLNETSKVNNLMWLMLFCWVF